MFLINLELVNLKNVVLVNFENLRRKTIKAKKKKVNGGKRILEKFAITASIVRDCKRTKKEFGPNGVKKRLEDHK